MRACRLLQGYNSYVALFYALIGITNCLIICTVWVAWMLRKQDHASGLVNK